MTKKVKRTISLAIAVIMLLSTMSVLAFAGTAEHTCVAGKPTQVGYAPANCTKDGYIDWAIKCTICGKVLECEREVLDKDPKAHVAADTTTIEVVKKPTCKTMGEYYEVTTCKFCGKVIEKTLYKVATTNDHIPDVAVKEPSWDETKGTWRPFLPSCAHESFYDSVVYCKVCDAELSRTLVRVAKVTDYHVSEYSLTRNITMVGPTTARVTFINTGINSTDPYAPNFDDRFAKYDDFGRAYIEKPADGIVTGTVVANKYANTAFVNNNGQLIGTTRTCADGQERCALCGKKINDAINHVWDKGVEVVPATATSQGLMTYNCLIKGCGAHYDKVTPPKNPSNVRGDLNADKVVTVGEARFILRYSVGLGNYDNVITNINFNNADYDGNGKVQPADAREALRCAVGLTMIVKF